MTLTHEQQAILSHVTTTTGLTLIDSVAGSGKTSLLTSIATTLTHTNGLYLAYNKAIAVESTRKFPKTTACMTTHSLAYQATVKPYSLKLGDFTYRNIIEKVSYDNKLLVIDTIRKFCLSSYLSVSQFLLDNPTNNIADLLIPRYLDLMATGKMECTHDFYLKFFHLHLASEDIEYDPFDFIMLDEAGDLNEVTLAIFQLLPSDRKIAVGDPFQNIYTFNHTINCFEVLRGQGTLFHMSKSFRVADYIAPRIETFCKAYLDPDMTFHGVSPQSTIIKTRAYITRTNSALIARMIELNNQNVEYGLVRKASEIFKTPLTLIGLKYQGFISDPTFKHLQADVDDWHESTNIRAAYKSPLLYIQAIYQDDYPLQQAIRLILRFGGPAIMSAYTEARKHEKSNQSYILATAHSCKGAEYDEVTIADDLNDSISDILAQLSAGRDRTTLTPTERESLNLYYVGCSRCAISLLGATHL